MDKRDCNNSGSRRFQFSMRMVLLVITVVCLVLGALELLLPRDVPIELRLMLYASTALGMTICWIGYRTQRQPWQPPADGVLVKVDPRWIWRVKSPYVFGPIAALTGVSLSFAPGYLLWCGQLQNWSIVQWILIVLSFATLYFVPGFYMRLAAEVIVELRKMELPPSKETKLSNGQIF